MDQDLEKRLATLEQKIDATYKSAEKTRKYFKWTLIVSVAVIVLPMIGLVFVIPQFLGTLSQYQNIGNLGL